MLERFENIPDMLELDHLTVSGDVTFGKNVTLKVIIGASECWDLEILLKRSVSVHKGTAVVVGTWNCY